MKTENEIPRRNRLDLNSPAEKSIYNSMQEVEKIGADVKLTKAIILLSDARNLVADFIDDNKLDIPKNFMFGDKVHPKYFPSIHYTFLCLVKYTSSKWFLENNGEWIEIAEKDQEKTKEYLLKEKNRLLFPDTIYSLSDNVIFEIKKQWSLMGLEDWKDSEVPDKPLIKTREVAHLKVEQTAIEEVFETAKDQKVDSICHKLGCGHAQRNPEGTCCMVPNNLKAKQEQSEVERLREESGYRPKIIKCSNCGQLWNTLLYEVCECGATIEQGQSEIQILKNENKQLQQKFINYEIKKR